MGLVHLVLHVRVSVVPNIEGCPCTLHRCYIGVHRCSKKALNSDAE